MTIRRNTPPTWGIVGYSIVKGSWRYRLTLAANAAGRIKHWPQPGGKQ